MWTAKATRASSELPADADPANDVAKEHTTATVSSLDRFDEYLSSAAPLTLGGK